MAKSEEGDAGKRAKSAERRVPAVSRAIAILRLLGRCDEPLGVNRIARELGLVPSTALHILRVLMAEELVACDEQEKKYELEAGMLTLSRAALRRNTFVRAVQPGLNRMARELGMTMLAAKVMGLHHAVVVATAPSSLPMRLHTEVGSRYPALISATGRCVAAFGGYKKSELSKHFNKLRWAKPVSFAAWWNQVQQTKLDGYSIDEGNFLAGVTVIAVPVIASGRMIYSIAAVGLHDQFSVLGIGHVATELRRLAKEMEASEGRP